MGNVPAAGISFCAHFPLYRVLKTVLAYPFCQDNLRLKYRRVAETALDLPCERKISSYGERHHFPPIWYYQRRETHNRLTLGDRNNQAISVK